MPDTSSVYRPRKSRDSQYYQCVEHNFETFEQVYEDRFERQYGFFPPYVRKVIYCYLDCGVLHNGFARLKCNNCGYEYLLALSCKRRHFCPSCHQKRVVEFGEWLCEQVVKAVPHRHFIFSIPKILRRYFLYNRGLLSELSRCGWELLKAFFQEAVPVEDPVLRGQEDAVPGAVIAIQSFGDFLGFNPHLQVLISDGCFYGNAMFRPALARLIGFEAGNAIFGSLNDPLLMSRITRSGPGVAPSFDTKDLENIFRYKVFKMLLSKGIITQDLVNMRFDMLTALS